MGCRCINAGDCLAVPKGTSVAYGLTVINEDTGSEYTLETGQVLVFAVSSKIKDPTNSQVLVKKLTNTVGGSYYLEFSPADTANLSIDAEYGYSIGIQHGSNVLYPVIEWAPFSVTPFAVKLGDGA